MYTPYIPGVRRTLVDDVDKAIINATVEVLMHAPVPIRLTTHQMRGGQGLLKRQLDTPFIPIHRSCACFKRPVRVWARGVASQDNRRSNPSGITLVGPGRLA